MTTTAVPAKFQRILADVETYVREHEGCSRSEVAAMVTGSNGSITAAVDRLIAGGRVVDFGRRLRWKVDAK